MQFRKGLQRFQDWSVRSSSHAVWFSIAHANAYLFPHDASAAASPLASVAAAATRAVVATECFCEFVAKQNSSCISFALASAHNFSSLSRICTA